MSRRRRKPRPGIAHYAAPVAFLAGVTIAVLLVHSALNRHTTTTATTPATTTVTTAPATTKRHVRPGAKRSYVVQSGDTFGTIAAKEGISVAQLEALNPGVSSNALRVGQRLRTR
jgi:LysM repeat protein